MSVRSRAAAPTTGLVVTLPTLVAFSCSGDPGYGGRTSADWIHQLSATDETSRAAAAQALERVLQLQPRMPNVVRALVRALADSSDLVRTAAGTALAAQGVNSPEAAPGLAAMLADSAHPNVRVTAARLLGMVETNTDTAVGALIAALRDGEPSVRAAAAESLGLIGPSASSAVPNVVDLFDDPQPAVRVKVLEALVSTRAATAITLPVFVRALNDSSRSVRATAAYALGALDHWQCRHLTRWSGACEMLMPAYAALRRSALAASVRPLPTQYRRW